MLRGLTRDVTPKDMAAPHDDIGDAPAHLAAGVNPCAEGGVVVVELPDGFAVTPESMRAMWRKVLEFARPRGHDRVLLAARVLTREMRPIDAYRHGNLLAALDPPGLRVACCFPDFEPDVVTWLFSRAANAGASNVEFFRSRDRSPALACAGLSAAAVSHPAIAAQHSILRTAPRHAFHPLGGMRAAIARCSPPPRPCPCLCARLTQWQNHRNRALSATPGRRRS